MKTNFLSDNPVIIQFPRYAGGKFISNCLALSRHSVPQNKQLAEYLLENPTDYDYRLTTVLNTLPPPNDMINWIDRYELGDMQLFGSGHLKWRRGENKNINDITTKLSNSKLKFFIVCHGGPDELINLLSVWPNAKILMLINHNKFSKISGFLKANSTEVDFNAGNYCKSKYELLSGPSWPSWDQFENAGFNTNNLADCQEDIRVEMNQYYKWNLIHTTPTMIDIDNSIFDQNKFLILIKHLYQILGFTDFNKELVNKFWQAYMALHVDNVDLM